MKGFPTCDVDDVANVASSAILVSRRESEHFRALFQWLNKLEFLHGTPYSCDTALIIYSLDSGKHSDCFYNNKQHNYTIWQRCSRQIASSSVTSAPCDRKELDQAVAEPLLSITLRRSPQARTEPLRLSVCHAHQSIQTCRDTVRPVAVRPISKGRRGKAGRDGNGAMDV